ncbi:replication protein P [Arsukibacterium indicum]|uniref:Uncharacterized protein n=1 Tax=Arsukibacterium indicum TaxID=2848612 RepID=A0ABS6MHB9_9GAMM|nr:replication protein P [Arsukibacterium indicum]MBV2128183.1 hypothetical protein [Arsukibacterium indicum]
MQLRVAEVTEKLTAELLPVLTLYYPIFAAQHCNNPVNIQAVLGQFAERMVIEGVTRKGFYAGIEQLKKRAGASAFILNPQAFAELCKTALTANLPSLQDVMFEIIQRRGVERYNTQYQFSHELSRLINERKGAMIYQLTSIEFEKAIKSEYDSWAKRIAAGEQLPEARACLADHTKPDLPEYLKNPVEPTCRIAKLAAQRSQGKA